MMTWNRLEKNGGERDSPMVKDSLGASGGKNERRGGKTGSGRGRSRGRRYAGRKKKVVVWGAERKGFLGGGKKGYSEMPAQGLDGDEVKKREFGRKGVLRVRGRPSCFQEG